MDFLQRLIPAKFFILLIILISGCQGEQVISIPDSCLQNGQMEHWETELLNANYTIQFPRGYRGGLEEDKFTKERKDEEVVILHNFCVQDICPDLGDTLISFNPSDVSLSIQNSTEVRMNKAIFYCCGNDTCGVYFLRDSTTFIGKYYLRADSIFRYAAQVTTSYNGFYEVLQILGTIRNK